MGNEKVRVGIIGVLGYGGIQLVCLLLEYFQVELIYLVGYSSVGKFYSDFYFYLIYWVNFIIEFIDLEAIVSCCDVVFFGLFNGLVCDMVLVLLVKGCKVLDLLVDYCFCNFNIYMEWYKKDCQD